LIQHGSQKKWKIASKEVGGVVKQISISFLPTNHFNGKILQEISYNSNLRSFSLFSELGNNDNNNIYKKCARDFLPQYVVLVLDYT